MRGRHLSPRFSGGLNGDASVKLAIGYLPMIKCPYCNKKHDVDDGPIECSCEAYGNRFGYWQDPKRGWFWIAKPHPESTVVDRIHCACFPKYARKIGANFICVDCGKPLR